MSSEKSESTGAGSLRLRALSRLTGSNDPRGTRANSAAALAILHDLASSPTTAADSLKLLHELQVYQVELDLQEEELRRAVTELEAALYRQVQLYEFSPAGCFTVDRATVLCGLNRAGARLLGFDQDEVLGRGLDGFLEPDSGRALHASLARIADGAEWDGCELQFVARAGVPQFAHASIGADPSGQRFLIACVAVREPATTTP